MKNALFVWIPKTAGTSLNAMLGRIGGRKLIWPQERAEFNQTGIVTFGHSGVFHLIKNGTMTQNFFDNAFKFAFVRNPWSRMVSLYEYSKRISRIPKEYTFLQYCERVKAGIAPLGAFHSKGLSQANPQSDWITRNGKIFVDYVGRFENFASDSEALFKLLGASAAVQHLNIGPAVNYRDYYCIHTKKIILDLYEEDIARFRYSF